MIDYSMEMQKTCICIYVYIYIYIYILFKHRGMQRTQETAGVHRGVQGGEGFRPPASAKAPVKRLERPCLSDFDRSSLLALSLSLLLSLLCVLRIHAMTYGNLWLVADFSKVTLRYI